MVHLLIEFHIQVLNDGLVPAGAGEIFSENHEDLLQHLVDDQDGVLLPELLWLYNVLGELEVHPVIEAILRGSIQLPQELLAGQVGVALLESKQVVAQGESCGGETQQDSDLDDALVHHGENRNNDDYDDDLDTETITWRVYSANVLAPGVWAIYMVI